MSISELKNCYSMIISDVVLPGARRWNAQNGIAVFVDGSSAFLTRNTDSTRQTLATNGFHRDAELYVPFSADWNAPTGALGATWAHLRQPTAI